MLLDFEAATESEEQRVERFFLGFLSKKIKIYLTLVTARKRSLGQGNNFTGVCLSTGGSLSRGMSLCPGVSVQGSLSRGSLSL